MNTLYADIIVDISHEKLDRTFQYRVPESLRGRLEPGACVMIPFGNGNRLIKGYVVALGETCQFAPEKIKEIAGDKAVVFVTGDLNTTCDDKALKPLTTYLNEASETVKKADKTPSFNNFGRRGSKLETIDHVLYRNAEATGFRVVDEPKFGINYISDHYPICSEFVITLPKN